MAKSFAVPALK